MIIENKEILTSYNQSLVIKCCIRQWSRALIRSALFMQCNKMEALLFQTILMQSSLVFLNSHSSSGNHNVSRRPPDATAYPTLSAENCCKMIGSSIRSWLVELSEGIPSSSGYISRKSYRETKPVAKHRTLSQQSIKWKLTVTSKRDQDITYTDWWSNSMHFEKLESIFLLQDVERCLWGEKVGGGRTLRWQHVEIKSLGMMDREALWKMKYLHSFI